MPGPVELRGEMRGGYCHPHALPKPLPKRTGSGLDTGGQSIFRMTRCLAIELAEVLDLLHREIISREVQQRVEKHRTMAAREDEAVASCPFRVARVVTQMTRP